MWAVFAQLIVKLDSFLFQNKFRKQAETFLLSNLPKVLAPPNVIRLAFPILEQDGMQDGTRG